MLLLALFGFTVELLDFEPRRGSVIKLALFEQPAVPGQLILGTWLVEASGLIALFLLTQGRFGTWWLDGLVAGWVGWIFRGPLLVITIVVAARQPQDPWWTLAFGWWVLYSVCGLSLALLARYSELEPWQSAEKTDGAASGASGASAVSESSEAASSEEPAETGEAPDSAETSDPAESADVDGAVESVEVSATGEATELAETVEDKASEPTTESTEIASDAFAESGDSTKSEAPVDPIETDPPEESGDAPTESERVSEVAPVTTGSVAEKVNRIE